MSDRLRKIVQESRLELGTREARQVDWNAIDQELFARIEQERRFERSRTVSVRRAPVWGLGAAALAAAACFALAAGKTHYTSSLDGTGVQFAGASPGAPSVAGNVVGILGSGELLIDGRPAPVGAELHLGNVLETRGTSVTVDRPGKLTMVFEAGTRATVTHTQGALILALDTGAVEAQVVPVASGEAFAVDVDGSRVAVHGTHLRVERAAEHVVVDLNEGVVVVGSAPRQGSTVGTLVTAPAHADFDATTLASTFVVTHEPAAVRAPVGIASAAPSTLATSVVLTLLPSAPAHTAEARVAAPAAQPVARPAARPPSQDQVAAPAPGPDPNAAATVASAVRACMAARPSAENVTVVVNTTLHVDLDDAGNVRAARFDPPVAPGVNACAAVAIYRTRWAHAGSADVPVDFKVPGPGSAP